MTNNNITNIPSPEEVTADTEYLNHIMDLMNTRFKEELEHAQGRSNFQIEKFIAMNDFTVSSVYKHILKNSSIMRREFFRTIKDGIEKQREFELRWTDKDKSFPVKWEQATGGSKYHWYDLDSMENKLFLQDLAISIKDKVQQLSFFDSILDELVRRNGGVITKEQFDAEEPIYWERRLKKQIGDDIANRLTGVGGGNLESIRNAVAPTLLPNSQNRILNMPSFDLLLSDPQKFLISLQGSIVETYKDITQIDSETVTDFNQQITDGITDSFGRDASTLDSLGISVKKQD